MFKVQSIDQKIKTYIHKSKAVKEMNRRSAAQIEYV